MALLNPSHASRLRGASCGRPPTIAGPLLALVLAAGAGAAPPPLPRGPELRVNVDTEVSHFGPAVAAFPNGRFVVAWTASDGARLRFFDAVGRPTSGERPLGIAGVVDQVVTNPAGGFWVVSTDLTAAGSLAVYTRRFDGQGAPRGGLIRVHAPSPSDRSEAVAALRGEDLAIAWRSRVDDAGGAFHSDAVGRTFDRRGTAVTPEITLREGLAAGPAGDDREDAFPTALALGPNGRLLAAVFVDGGCRSHRLVGVAADGSPEPLAALGSCASSPTGAALAIRPGGSFVAGWSDDGLLKAQRFAPDWTRRGEVLDVAAGRDPQADPAAAALTDGSVALVWSEAALDPATGASDPTGVFGRILAPAGTPRTPVFVIGDAPAEDRSGLALAASRRGAALVVWSQTGADGRSDVFARLLSSRR